MLKADDNGYKFLGPGCQPKVGILDLLLAMFMVCLSVCLSVRCPMSVGHDDELWQNGWTDRDAVWHVGGVGHSHHVLDGGPDPPTGRGNLGVGKGLSHSKV